MDTGQLIECHSCGRRQPIHLAVNQVELAQVGMLELPCLGCAKLARWQLVASRRRDERRELERRDQERRLQMVPAPLQGRERRGGRERRLGPIRKIGRRADSTAAVQ